MRQQNIADAAARMARAATSDLANLHSAMRSSTDTTAGLARAIKAPNTTPKRTRIKGATETSFYLSAAQNASEIYNMTMLAQRIL